MVRLKGTNGAWALVKGGMGTLTRGLADNARRAGARLFRARVASIDASGNGKETDLVADGVTLSCGKRVRARVGVVAACDPWALCGLSPAVAASCSSSFWAPAGDSSSSPPSLPSPSSSSSKSATNAPAATTTFQERLDTLYVPATTFKLNLALSALPRFACLEGRGAGGVGGERGGDNSGPEHRTTAHLLASSPDSADPSSSSSSPSPVDLLHDACVAALKGDLSFVDAATGRHPPIEFYFHSAADPSVRQGGEEDGEGEGSKCHSAALFVQLAPHAPGVSLLEDEERGGGRRGERGRRRQEGPLLFARPGARPASFELSRRAWTEGATEAYSDSLLAAAEAWCPGLRSLVVDAVPYPPPAIESKFGISAGHIHHVQNTKAFGERVPLRVASNLFFASAGAHPGGSVTGAPGHNAAAALLMMMPRKKEEVLSWPTIKREKGAASSSASWREFARGL